MLAVVGFRVLAMVMFLGLAVVGSLGEGYEGSANTDRRTDRPYGVILKK